MTDRYRHFWDGWDYFTSPEPMTENLVRRAEELLGYKLPLSYVELLYTKNGGTPINTCFPTNSPPTSWAEDHVAISGIRGIGGKWGIDSEDLGSLHMIEDWGYPRIGIVVCECPSAGHDAVMLDYRKSGPLGEPEVVHVDVEVSDEPVITFLAKDFASFLSGLVSEERYDKSEEEYQADLEKVKSSPFSPLLRDLVDKSARPDNLERCIRRICTRIVEAKKHFSLHSDSLSHLMYDIQFWLYSRQHHVDSVDQYLQVYSSIIAIAKGFSTGGYAPDFIKDWFALRLRTGAIENGLSGLRFTPQAERALGEQIERDGVIPDP